MSKRLCLNRALLLRGLTSQGCRRGRGAALSSIVFVYGYQLMRPLTSRTFWSAIVNSCASMPPLSCNACSVHPETIVHRPVLGSG